MNKVNFGLQLGLFTHYFSWLLPRYFDTVGLGDRKGIQPVKTSASKPLGMAVNVGGQGTAKYHVGTKAFGLSCEDA